MKPNMTPRALFALATAGASLFLLLCFCGYGAADAADARGPRGFADAIAAAFVRPLGAGAHVIAILGLAWGVVVYFQERTPDLVLRTVGTLCLAGSTALLVGLLPDNQHSPWAGSVGSVGARTFASMGTLGTVLGWLVALPLAFVSLVFATDWLFHTLRRGDRPVFDPRTLPTEPSRGDLLEEPADAEPRAFVANPSRAAECVDDLAVEEPRPLEVRSETLPEGFSAAPAPAAGGRTLVRGPSGYAGVEFLPTNDELAIPAPAAEESIGGGETIETSFAEDWDLVDVVLDPHDSETTDAPTQAAETLAATPDLAEEEAPPAPAAAPAPAAEEPSHGIALADASLLVDEVFALPASFDDADLPSDGASAVAEIASTWRTDDVAPAAAAPEPAAPAPAEASEFVAEDDEPGPRFEDDLLVAPGAQFEDDVLYVYEESPGLAARAPSVPEAAHAALEQSATVAVAELAAPIADLPEPVVSGRSVTGTVAITPEEIAAARAMAMLASPEPAALAEAAAMPVAAEAAVVSTELGRAEEPAAAETPATPEPVAEPVVAEPVAEPVVAEPVVETPVAAAEPAPVAVAVAPAAPAAEPAVSADAAAASQLALFPPPSCDLAKLAAMELDPLFHDAARAILGRGRASAVVLQRALGIGYARGLRILDQMTEAGMLGPDSPGGAREICFTQAQWDAYTA